jgi:multidrug efflux pump subunit AcrA (membrane-fusion protein)
MQKVIAMFMSAFFFSLFCAIAAQPVESLPSSVNLDGCDITLDEEAEVAAQEPGVLVQLPVQEGQEVKADELLAQLDDSLPRMELRVAENKLKVAEEQATNDVNVRYSKASAEVAYAEYLQAVEANKKVAGSKSLAEVRELLLKHKYAVLSIEKSEMDLRIAALQVNVSKAEMDQAAKKVERHKIKSPLDGQVQKINFHVGEWVQAGEPVVHVVRVNRLRTEGYLNTATFAPQEVNGRPVTIKVQLARGRVETFNGKIVFVDPKVLQGGKYRVRAVIQNRQENGQWLLRAGMMADMTIQLK